MRRSGAVCGNVNFEEYTFIGYTLPTIGEYVSAKYIYLYWIYSANNWGIYDSWRVSVRPSGRWVGEHVSVEYIYIYIYWIYSANNWGIYDILRVSVRPSGAG